MAIANPNGLSLRMIEKLSLALKSIARKYPLLLFYGITLVIAILYYYHILFFSPPQSIHRWRQTDSASITLNLYQHGMKFFQPEVHSLSSDDFTSGYAAAEAPLLYYLIALLYKIFGPHEAVYRIVNTIVFLIGLGALFKIARHFLHDFLPAAFVPLLVFVSPVVAYYGNNFLTDSTALALVFSGWWQFIRYLNSRRYACFIAAIILFALSGLLKATMTLNLFALGGLAVIETLNLLPENGKRLFPRPLATYLPMLVGMAVVVLWYSYAIRFNRIHHSSTFLTGIAPWWILSSGQRQEITRFIVERNLTMYYSRGVLYILAVFSGLILVYFRRLPKFMGIITLFLAIGGVTYVALFYSQFQYHDYYILILFSPIAFIALSALFITRSEFPRIYASWYFSVLICCMIAVNVYHARQEMTLRYFGWKREYPVFEDHFTIRPYLRSIGIQPGERVISMPDYTNCYTLYLMNQPGNNLGDVGPKTNETIRKFVAKGARYLVINDTSFLSHPEIQEFIQCKIGEYRAVQIFRIDSCFAAYGERQEIVKSSHPQ